MGCLFFLRYAKLIVGDRNLSTFQDNTYLLHPIFAHLSRSFERGDYPYWMNAIVGGLPLYNSPQFSAEYPFYFLRSGLYSGPLAALMNVHAVTLLHFVILYVNSYVLMRTLRLKPVAALFSASLFAFSPCVAVAGSWLNIVAPYSWFPLAVASIVMVLEDQRAKAGILLGVIAISLLALASPSQPLIHLMLVAVLLYICYAVDYLFHGAAATVWRVTRHLAVVALVAFVISSPAVVPALLDARETIRFLGDFPPVIGNAKIPFNAFLVGQVVPSALAASVVPLRFPIVLGDPYVGAGTALFALFGVFSYRSNRIVLPMAALTAYGLLSAAGSHLGLAQINYHLPLIDKIREPSRHLILFVFGASTLAGFGLEYLADILKSGYRQLGRAKHLCAMLVFVGVLAVAFRTPSPYVGLISKGGLLAILGLTVALLLMLRWAEGWKRVFVTSAAALSVLYMNSQYPFEPPRWSDGDYFTASNLSSHKVLGELSNIPNIRQFRIIFADDRFNTQFWSMNASYYQLRSFQAYMNPLPYRQFDEVFQRFNLRHYYPLLGAKYYLCSPCDARLSADYDFVREVEGYKLNVARQVLPRYSIMNRLAGSYGDVSEFMAKIDEGFDYTHEFYVGAADTARVTAWLGDQSAPAITLKEESTSLNHLTISVNTSRRSMFVLNEFFNRAWKGQVNGVSVQPIRINANQIGVLLDQGANLVHLEYRPTLFIALLWLQRGLIAALTLYGAYRGSSAIRRFAQRRRSRLADPGDLSRLYTLIP